jgi:hypothetical protein
VDWLGTTPTSADQLLACAARAETVPRDRAAAFLEQFLAGGPRTSRDLWQAAQKAGLSTRTLQRAKRNLDIRCRRIYTDGRPVSYWLLPGQKAPSGLSDFPDVAAWLDQLEKEFPPRDPLDKDDLDPEGN